MKGGAVQLPEGPEQGPQPGGEHPEAAEELPTMPPAPRRGPGLRWAVPEPESRSVPLTRQVPRVPPAPGDDQTRAPAPRPVPGRGRPRPPLPPSTRPEPPALPAPSSASSVPWSSSPGGRAGRRASGRRRVAWALGAGVLVAALAAGTVIALGQAPSPRPATVFEQLLEKSAHAHRLVVAAVGDACSSSAPEQAGRRTDVAELGQAVSLRSSVLRQLSSEAMVARRLPSGPLLFSELGTVTRDSLQADRSYLAWLGDLQATGCYGGPTNDINYRAAAQAATQADEATRQLEATWANVAPQLKMAPGLAAQA